MIHNDRMALQNIYDDPDFFEGYLRLRATDTGLNGVLEQPAIRALIPAVATTIETITSGVSKLPSSIGADGFGTAQFDHARGGNQVDARPCSRRSWPSSCLRAFGLRLTRSTASGLRVFG